MIVPIHTLITHLDSPKYLREKYTWIENTEYATFLELFFEHSFSYVDLYKDTEAGMYDCVNVVVYVTGEGQLKALEVRNRDDKHEAYILTIPKSKLDHISYSKGSLSSCYRVVGRVDKGGSQYILDMKIAEKPDWILETYFALPRLDALRLERAVLHHTEQHSKHELGFDLFKSVLKKAKRVHSKEGLYRWLGEGLS